MELEDKIMEALLEEDEERKNTCEMCGNVLDYDLDGNATCTSCGYVSEHIGGLELVEKAETTYLVDHKDKQVWLKMSPDTYSNLFKSWTDGKTQEEVEDEFWRIINTYDLKTIRDLFFDYVDGDKKRMGKRVARR
jgi:hypothetical protein